MTSHRRIRFGVVVALLLFALAAASTSASSRVTSTVAQANASSALAASPEQAAVASTLGSRDESTVSQANASSALAVSPEQVAVAAAAGVDPRSISFTPGSAIATTAGGRWGVVRVGNTVGGATTLTAEALGTALPPGGTALTVINMATLEGTRVILDRNRRVIQKIALGTGRLATASFNGPLLLDDPSQPPSVVLGRGRAVPSQIVFYPGACVLVVFDPWIAWVGPTPLLVGEAATVCNVPAQLLVFSQLWQCCFLHIADGLYVSGYGAAASPVLGDCVPAPYYS
jgi:hypothetical protein